MFEISRAKENKDQISAITGVQAVSFIKLEVSDIPHGHGLSFKRGVSDGLLEHNLFQNDIHSTNLHSYKRGLAVGQELKKQIANKVKT